MSKISLNFLNLEDMTIQKLILSAGIIVFLLIVNAIAKFLIEKNVKNYRSRYNLFKTSTYTIVIVGVFFIGRVWFLGFQTIATFLGLLSAGIAIALREIILNIAGWLFIIWRKPFEVGQRIQIGDDAGDVIDIRPFQFTILEIGKWVSAEQSTGRMIHIPNGSVFTLAISNYESGFAYIWNELNVMVTFESNWKKAKELLQEVLDTASPKITNEVEKQIINASKKYLIYYKNLTPIVYTSLKDSGIVFSLRYICVPRNRRTTENDIWENVLSVFALHNDIDLAYPTTRFYNNLNEGKTLQPDKN
jgi:small-conductance mechanosensitive channel